LLCKNLPLEILKELKNQSETIYKNSQKNSPIYFIQGKKFLALFLFSKSKMILFKSLGRLAT